MATGQSHNVLEKNFKLIYIYVSFINTVNITNDLIDIDM